MSCASKVTFLNAPSNSESLPSLHLCAASLSNPGTHTFPLKEAAGVVETTHPRTRGSQRAPVVSLCECRSATPSSVTRGICLRCSTWPLSTLTFLLSFSSDCLALLSLFLHLGISEDSIKQNHLGRSLGFSFEQHHCLMWETGGD